MPDKMMRMQRAVPSQGSARRPRMLAIAGDSAAGKTTLTRGIVEALGAERCTAVCIDDYHRYDRQERKALPFSPLNPECNYVEVMEQHLQLLATGQPILKPVYDHADGSLVRPVLVEPADYVIGEGLLPLHTRLAQACFDVTVYVDPPDDVRRAWKVKRDTADRGYGEEEVLASLTEREPDSEAFIRPQRSKADMVVRFSPIAGRDDPPDTPLSATLLLRSTISHPDLSVVLADSAPGAPMHLKMLRDDDGRPVDALHIHGYAPASDTEVVKKLIWDGLEVDAPLPPALGRLGDGQVSQPLAITQLILIHHLLKDG
ncbi:MAG: phosphoribulokinase [Iamia sp.]